jgi:hypothetical protein
MQHKAKKKRTLIHYLPVYGSMATGLTYVTIGTIALLSFLKIRDGGADESSMIAILNESVAGKILIWIILLGTLSYIAWRIYETIADPYGYGNDIRGKLKRTGIALSSVADVLIVYATVKVLLGIGNIQLNGEPEEERAMVADILQSNGGRAIVIVIGAIILITAVVQFVYGITRGYKERIDVDHFSTIVKSAIHAVAWAGYSARGIILGIIGFFFAKAGMLGDAKFVVNTDKAFDFIGDHVGHFYFIIVAIGTICYGLFMFALGFAYDSDKD